MISFERQCFPIVLAVLMSLLAGVARPADEPPAAPSDVATASPTSPLIDTIIEDAMEALFRGERERLWLCVVEMQELEKSFPWAGTTHLSDNILALYAVQSSSRAEFLSNLHAVEISRPDSLLRQQVETLRATDPYIAAEQLGRERVYNRYAGIFNYLSRQMSRLFSGNTQVLLQIPVDLLFGWRNWLLVDEFGRKQDRLYAEFIGREPDSYLAPEATKKLGKLDKKILKERRRRLEKIGDMEQKLNHPQESLFTYYRALEVTPDDHDLKQKIADLTEELSTRQRNRYRSVTIVEGESALLESDRGESYRQMVQNLWFDTPEEFRARLILARSKDFRSPMRSDQGYLIAATRERDADFDRARLTYETVAGLREEGSGAERAATAVSQPLLDPVRAAEMGRKRLARERRLFIAFGSRTAEDELYLASTGIVQAPSAALENLGIFFVLDVAIRWVQTSFSNPLPQDALIDPLRDLLRRFPESPNADKWRSELTGRYELSGNFTKAKSTLARSGALSVQQAEEYDDKIARQWVVYAESQETVEEKIQTLEYVTDKFPQTPMASVARSRLKPLYESLDREFRIPADWLRKSGPIWREAGLPLEAELWDGNWDNGEIADEGIAVYKTSGGGTLHFELEGSGSNFDETISEPTLERLRAFHDESEQERRAIARSEERFKRQILPMELLGSAGGSGILAYPTFKPFAFDKKELPLYQ